MGRFVTLFFVIVATFYSSAGNAAVETTLTNSDCGVGSVYAVIHLLGGYNAYSEVRETLILANNSVRDSQRLSHKHVLSSNTVAELGLVVFGAESIEH